MGENKSDDFDIFALNQWSI